MTNFRPASSSAECAASNIGNHHALVGTINLLKASGLPDRSRLAVGKGKLEEFGDSRERLCRRIVVMRDGKPLKIQATVAERDQSAPREIRSKVASQYKAALSVAYGAGLRVSEVVSLKVSGIDSQRMMLRVEQGKGRKDRHAMLSPVLLELLRGWYRIARPQGWLFPGQNRISPMSTRQLTRACHAAAQMAEISKRRARRMLLTAGSGGVTPPFWRWEMV